MDLFASRFVRFSLLCVVLLGLCGGVISCTDTKSSFDRETLFLELSKNVVIPGYEAFSKQATALEEETKTFCQGPTADGLKKLQEQWLETKKIWRQVQAFRFGPAMYLSAKAHIDDWPVKTNLIEQELEKTTSWDDKAIDALGSSRRGLATLEYLMFSNEKSDDDILALWDMKEAKGKQRCAFAIGVAHGVVRRVELILADWKGKAGAAVIENFTSPGQSAAVGPQYRAVDHLINEFIYIANTSSDILLGQPLGHNDGGTPKPDALEALRSGSSLAHVKAFMNGLKVLYTGEFGTNKGKGMSALVAHMHAETDTRLKQELEAALKALDAISVPLSKAIVEQRDAVKAAYDAIKLVEQTLSIDVVSHLGVTVTFSDNDGD